MKNIAITSCNNESKLVLGTVQFGLNYGINNLHGKTKPQEVCTILNMAYESGIKCLDTSYGYGDSESIIGETLSNHAFQFQIISKYPQNSGEVKDVFNRSLQRLKVSHVYGYMVHHFSYFKDNSSIWDDFRALKNDAKVDKIGFSLYSPDELEYLFKHNICFDIIQFPYNVFDRRFESYMVELKQRGVEIHVRSTFLQGLFYKDRETLPARLQPLKKYLLLLDDFAKEKNLSIEDIALGYNLQNPHIDGVLTGVDNSEQLRSNIYASQKNVIIDLQIKVKEKELLNPVNWN
ncbi:MAG: aldo/keto reductase [Bacteroidales bacterium]|jgi:aryl-alcohol dehydrogenase-like predicted oxidoreductase|nr:aldo/keto reductase [Bacteroidales bacterium]